MWGPIATNRPMSEHRFYSRCESPIGTLLLMAGQRGLSQIWFEGQDHRAALGAESREDEVALRDVSTNSSQVLLTNETGRYNFINVSPGFYDVTISRSGFKAAKIMGQKVEIGLVLTLNVTLEVGSTLTTVEVTSTPGADLQTTNATVGTTISGDMLMAMANLGRDANALFVFQPAVAPTGEVSGAARDQNT